MSKIRNQRIYEFNQSLAMIIYRIKNSSSSTRRTWNSSNFNCTVVTSALLHNSLMSVIPCKPHNELDFTIFQQFSCDHQLLSFGQRSADDELAPRPRSEDLALSDVTTNKYVARYGVHQNENNNDVCQCQSHFSAKSKSRMKIGNKIENRQSSKTFLIPESKT